MESTIKITVILKTKQCRISIHSDVIWTYTDYSMYIKQPIHCKIIVELIYRKTGMPWDTHFAVMMQLNPSTIAITLFVKNNHVNILYSFPKYLHVKYKNTALYIVNCDIWYLTCDSEMNLTFNSIHAQYIALGIHRFDVIDLMWYMFIKRL